MYKIRVEFRSWGRDRYWRPNIAEVNDWVQQVPELPRLDAVKPVILRNNRWRCDHGWDIDLDDGSSYYIITNNLCLRGGIKNREGYGRVVENNIMVGSGFHPHVWFAASGDIFRRNIADLGEMSAFGLPGVTGVLVLEIPAGSALAKAGLQQNDVILSVNRTKVTDVATLLQEAPALAPFQTLLLGISRQQKESVLTVTP